MSILIRRTNINFQINEKMNRVYTHSKTRELVKDSLVISNKKSASNISFKGGDSAGAILWLSAYCYKYWNGDGEELSKSLDQSLVDNSKRSKLVKLLIAATPPEKAEELVKRLIKEHRNFIDEIGSITKDVDDLGEYIESLRDLPNKLKKIKASLANLNMDQVILATSRTTQKVSKTGGYALAGIHMLLGNPIAAIAAIAVTEAGNKAHIDIQKRVGAKLYFTDIKRKLALMITRGQTEIEYNQVFTTDECLKAITEVIAPWRIR